MLTRRVGGSAAAAEASPSISRHADELDIVYPPPRTPNLPATAGSARIAVVAEPPLRFRSGPHPQRNAAGLESAYNWAKRSMSAAGTRVSAAARSRVHGAA